MPVTKLRIRNYRGIEALDAEIPAAGAVAQGGNARGKTSVLRAIAAALAARDVGPDAIRHGADRAELLVDLEDVAVRRLITHKGTSLTVERGGMKARSPQGYLTELLGTAAIDPLELYLDKPERRRARILEALPVTVTVEQLQRWAPVPANEDVRGHGLEVLARVHKRFYDERTEANRAAKEALREAERLGEEAQAKAFAEPLLKLDAAHTEVSEARAAKILVEERTQQAAEQREKQSTARARLAGLREQATTKRTSAASLRVDEDPLRARIDVLQGELEAMRRAMADKRAEHDKVVATLNQACDDNDRAEALTREAEGLEQAAADAEGLLASAIPEPDPEAETRAAERVKTAEGLLVTAQRWHDFQVASAAAKIAVAAAARTQDRRDELDAIVKRLDAAPSELLVGGAAIPGLSLEGDEVLLDGVRLGVLSGAEQMRFAVEIAKRLNAKAKILVCDGLERLDGEQLRDFVRLATAGGWQLLASRVTGGDLVLEGIEGDDEDAPGSSPRLRAVQP